jgi:hypothetical protein
VVPSFTTIDQAVIKDHLITAQWTFWIVGVGSMLATCAGLLVFFHRKGWV